MRISKIIKTRREIKANLREKLYGNGGWSSKKYNGHKLIKTSIILTFLITLASFKIDGVRESFGALMIAPGAMLTSGLACFGIDAKNKITHKKYESQTENK